MSRLDNLKRHTQAKPNNRGPAADNSIQFAFGDPTPVLDSRDIMGLMELSWMEDYWVPPINPQGLAKSFDAATYHQSALYWKLNKLCAHYQPHKLMTRSDFRRYAKDFLIFANAYVERVDNLLGKPLQLKISPAMHTRRVKDKDQYVFLKSYREKHYFEESAVFHALEPDIKQEFYGVPTYMAALHSAWLDESATLFRRKYYSNGSHAGYILYMTDAANKETDVISLKEAMKRAKGPGNFRNMFMYAPNGKKDGLQVIPLAEATAKDEFFNIKRASMKDQLAAHRLPPQSLGVIPENNGGFGDASKADELAYKNEIVPLQTQLAELNDWLGQEVITFLPYQSDNQPTEG